MTKANTATGVEPGNGTTLAEALRRATAELAAAGVPSPRVDAELLAAHLLGESAGRIRALAFTDAPAPEGYNALVAERAARVPLQHLTGKAHFRYLELAVGPGVFVPRPETETVAQLAIDAARRAGPAKVVDLGTGSGAIAAAVASEVPAAEVYAVELSPLAFAWAEQNLAPLGVQLVLDDLRTALADHDASFDVVVSNPPYIPAEAVPNEPEAAEHDPAMALYGGGADGLELPMAAARSAARLLVPGGYFVMEHAEVQAPAIARLLAADPAWTDVVSHRDLNDRPRATSAVRRTGPMASTSEGILP
ncbi:MULTISPECIES: peptide chain release factor N(5)-glutamine methyltransferase [unclassified Arthrobacter]|uniref:peptide chain release factor N(5)-glutamine methyltransferase n=1 Tax=unclassified Arthrobacter TaxID=235627 RepID=UPI0024DFBEE6|nr:MULTISPECIES: peptide chain release factor N(5)-glutamine methyltransferase [unclassified Arthrobacter]MCC9146544.1 peptide chain release factor N(5)-glutamine methyltransferase [Arthrobacter sp. zg-Y919]MDK1277774.1 peptide chain release factor N(5)-glutamine methyltransferase [Arthrobacter sp. zg.Y919]WIB02271.1 peptide chain release factor N(5)-glutamine methyltransferase [Arthrobacter sp. zg-Y919]